MDDEDIQALQIAADNAIWLLMEVIHRTQHTIDNTKHHKQTQYHKAIKKLKQTAIQTLETTLPGEAQRIYDLLLV